MSGRAIFTVVAERKEPAHVPGFVSIHVAYAVVWQGWQLALLVLRMLR
jgi:hypothetical protein